MSLASKLTTNKYRRCPNCPHHAQKCCCQPLRPSAHSKASRAATTRRNKQDDTLATIASRGGGGVDSSFLMQQSPFPMQQVLVPQAQMSDFQMKLSSEMYQNSLLKNENMQLRKQLQNVSAFVKEDSSSTLGNEGLGEELLGEKLFKSNKLLKETLLKLEGLSRANDEIRNSNNQLTQENKHLQVVNEELEEQLGRQRKKHKKYVQQSNNHNNNNNNKENMEGLGNLTNHITHNSSISQEQGNNNHPDLIYLMRRMNDLERDNSTLRQEVQKTSKVENHHLYLNNNNNCEQQRGQQQRGQQQRGQQQRGQQQRGQNKNSQKGYRPQQEAASPEWVAHTRTVQPQVITSNHRRGKGQGCSEDEDAAEEDIGVFKQELQTLSLQIFSQFSHQFQGQLEVNPLTLNEALIQFVSSFADSIASHSHLLHKELSRKIALYERRILQLQGKLSNLIIILRNRYLRGGRGSEYPASTSSYGVTGLGKSGVERVALSTNASRVF